MNRKDVCLHKQTHVSMKECTFPCSPTIYGSGVETCRPYLGRYTSITVCEYNTWFFLFLQGIFLLSVRVFTFTSDIGISSLQPSDIFLSSWRISLLPLFDENCSLSLLRRFLLISIHPLLPAVFLRIHRLLCRPFGHDETETRSSALSSLPLPYIFPR